MFDRRRRRGISGLGAYALGVTLQVELLIASLRQQRRIASEAIGFRLELLAVYDPTLYRQHYFANGASTRKVIRHGGKPHVGR